MALDRYNKCIENKLWDCALEELVRENEAIRRAIVEEKMDYAAVARGLIQNYLLKYGNIRKAYDYARKLGVNIDDIVKKYVEYECITVKSPKCFDIARQYYPELYKLLTNDLWALITNPNPSPDQVYKFAEFLEKNPDLKPLAEEIIENVDEMIDWYRKVKAAREMANTTKMSVEQFLREYAPVYIVNLIKKIIETEDKTLIDKLVKFAKDVGIKELTFCPPNKPKTACITLSIHRVADLLRKAIDTGALDIVKELSKYLEKPLNQLSIGELEKLMHLIERLMEPEIYTTLIQLQLTPGFEELKRIYAHVEFQYAIKKLERCKSYYESGHIRMAVRCIEDVLDKLRDAGKYIPEAKLLYTIYTTKDLEALALCILGKYGLTIGTSRYVEGCEIYDKVPSELKRQIALMMFATLTNKYIANELYDMAYTLAKDAYEKGLIPYEVYEKYEKAYYAWLAYNYAKHIKEKLDKKDITSLLLDDVKKMREYAEKAGAKDLVDLADKLEKAVNWYLYIKPAVERIQQLITDAFRTVGVWAQKGGPLYLRKFLEARDELYKLYNNLKDKNIDVATLALDVGRVLYDVYRLFHSVVELQRAIEAYLKAVRPEEYRSAAEEAAKAIAEAHLFFESYMKNSSELLSIARRIEEKYGVSGLSKMAENIVSTLDDMASKFRSMIVELIKTAYNYPPLWDAIKSVASLFGVKPGEKPWYERLVDWYNDFSSFSYELARRLEHDMGPLFSSLFYGATMAVVLPRSIHEMLKTRMKQIKALIRGDIKTALSLEAQLLRGLIPHSPGEALGMILLAIAAYGVARAFPKIGRIIEVPFRAAFPELEVVGLLGRLAFGRGGRIYEIEKVPEEVRTLEDVVSERIYEKVREIAEKYKVPEYVAREYAVKLSRQIIDRLEKGEIDKVRELIEKYSEEELQRYMKELSTLLRDMREYITKFNEKLKMEMKPVEIKVPEIAVELAKLVEKLDEIKLRLENLKGFMDSIAPGLSEKIIKEIESVREKAREYSEELPKIREEYFKIVNMIENIEKANREITELKAEAARLALDIGRPDIANAITRATDPRMIEEYLSKAIADWIKNRWYEIEEISKKLAKIMETLDKRLTVLNNILKNIPGAYQVKLEVTVEDLRLPSSVMEKLEALRIKTRTIAELTRELPKDLNKMTLAELEEIARILDNLLSDIRRLKEALPEEVRRHIKINEHGLPELVEEVKKRIEVIRNSYRNIIGMVEELKNTLRRLGREDLVRKLDEAVGRLPETDMLKSVLRDIVKELSKKGLRERLKTLLDRLRGIRGMEDIYNLIEQELKKAEEEIIKVKGAGGLKIEYARYKIVKATKVKPEELAKLVELVSKEPRFRIGDYTVERTVTVLDDQIIYRIRVRGKGTYAEYTKRWIYRRGRVETVDQLIIDPKASPELRAELVEVLDRATREDPLIAEFERIYIGGKSMLEEIREGLREAITLAEIGATGVHGLNTLRNLIESGVQIPPERLPDEIRRIIDRFGIKIPYAIKISDNIFILPVPRPYIPVLGKIPIFKWNTNIGPIIMPTIKIDNIAIGLVPEILVGNIEITGEKIGPIEVPKITVAEITTPKPKPKKKPIEEVTEKGVGRGGKPPIVFGIVPMPKVAPGAGVVVYSLPGRLVRERLVI